LAALLFGLAVVLTSAIASLRPEWPLHRIVAALPGGDLTGHFLLVGGSAFLATLGFGPSAEQGWTRLVLPALAVTIFATADEISQIYLAERDFAWTDLAANYAGILFFSALAIAWLRWGSRPRAEGEDPAAP
jgi:VanZ family protein